jgi:hypothetical protein
MNDQMVAAGLGLLGVPPLPDPGLLDEHIEVAERAAAPSDPGRFLGDDEGPAAEAPRADLTGSSGALADIASRFETQGRVLRTARGIIDGAAVLLAALALAAGYFPELLLRLRAMARRIGSMIRTVIEKVGDVLRRLTGGRLSAKIERVAGRAHDHWRSQRLRADGGYEPRVRRTIDERWIKRHGVDQVDIANTHYRDLPADMRRDNWESADVAIRLIRDGARRGVNVRSDDFLETASSSVHDAWLFRNGFRATAEQRLPYAELSDVEKAKDRVFILNALDVL